MALKDLLLACVVILAWGEHLSTLQMAGALCVMAGLAVNVFGGAVLRRVRRVCIRT